MIFIPHKLRSTRYEPFLEQSLTTHILKIHISSIPRFKSCNNSDFLSCIFSRLNLNDDQNLIYPDNFLGSADYLVPTSFSRLLSAQSTTSSWLRANISLLTLNWQNPLTTSYNTSETMSNLCYVFFPCWACCETTDCIEGWVNVKNINKMQCEGKKKRKRGRCIIWITN